MPAFLQSAHSFADYMPHGMCLLWIPELMALHIVSDALIALAYFSIPAALIFFVTRRRDLPFQNVFILFGLFIVACGTTHVMGVVTLWNPVYELDGAIKAFTALVSVPTAFMLWRLMPQALALPSQQQLQDANRALSVEVSSREQAERAIRELNATLERRVEERTAELAAANAALRKQVEERERAERSEASAHARLTDAVDGLPAAFRLFDRDEKLVIANRHQPLNEVLPEAPIKPGASFPEIVRLMAEHDIDAGSVGRRDTWISERLAQFRAGNTDAEAHWRDGRWFQVLERRTSEGGTVSIEIDISARKKIEEQLYQSQKLEAVGQLTGGVAHDFNNLLTVILGNAETLVQNLTDNQRLRVLAELTQTAAERGSALTNRLLAFSRRQALEPKTIDVNRLVSGMDGLLRRTLGEHIEIEFVRGAGLWRALVDPAQLESALLNLAINARDAMPGGGRLTIETANAHIDGRYSAAHDEVAAGQYVLIAVSDTGEGMTSEVAARAFEPFFSTKEVGKGSGLGLSMVYGFVKQSGGHVKIYSEAGHGTSVKIYLPRSDATPEVEEVRDMVDALGTGMVLVVEDDDLVRAHAEATVRSLGYDVLTAENGAAALDILKSDVAIDLLFTDIVMPGGISGRQLAEAAVVLRPALKVLFTSGYTENAVVHHGRLDPGIQLLQKPYRRSELAAKLSLAMGQTTGGDAMRKPPNGGDRLRP